jgi:hypothetical protein
MHAALSEDLAQHKKARWLTPAIFAILRGTVIMVDDRYQYVPHSVHASQCADPNNTKFLLIRG